MRYKTTIEIVTDAQDKNEAFEIAGEYLSGNIASGVEMSCLTKPASGYPKCTISVIALSLLLIIGAYSLVHVRTFQVVIPVVPGINAIQPPLKTSANVKNSEFRKEWHDKQISQALDYLKK